MPLFHVLSVMAPNFFTQILILAESCADTLRNPSSLPLHSQCKLVIQASVQLMHPQKLTEVGIKQYGVNEMKIEKMACWYLTSRSRCDHPFLGPSYVWRLGDQGG
eukprot:TRINITY_DN13209_c0_g2_i3.p1 TRINITY_DN13209_c0_g2~~TRINITY_DN13209_c0_g2_i3.p1  ORF type:complete len:105 (-),score=7.15 TRINITY_DN13209_c0_g2_i3:187-501(-)